MSGKYIDEHPEIQPLVLVILIIITIGFFVFLDTGMNHPFQRWLEELQKAWNQSIGNIIMG